MKLIVTGSSGLVGSALLPALSESGHEVTRLVRDPSATGSVIQWDPALENIDRAHLEGFDGVVHLAGESIASGRWTKAKKQRIRDSRVKGTRLLAKALANLEKPPKVLVCASAVGYYGDRGDEVLDEQSPAGNSFLADVCKEWEEAAAAARDKGIRVVHLRIGIVLSRDGGALQKMLLPFKIGAGGVVGNGSQYWSWIALDDVVGAIQHALTDDSLSGPVNCVAPDPPTNREFTKALGRVLNRPTVLPVPAFGARLLLGEMGTELLLASTRVVPKKLQAAGYPFRHAGLEDALRHALGK